jgi:hypothetical protein
MNNLQTMDFNGHLADAETNMDKCGFKTELYTPLWEVDEKEMEAFETPFRPQLLATYQSFLYFFGAHMNRAWVHLAAEMQAGKTGVINGVIRLVLANAKKVGIRPQRIFVITGMNDNAWKIQTKKRMIQDIRENIHHLSGLQRVARKLYEIASASELSNILIFLDESHIAAQEDNLPYKLIFNTLKSLCPIEKWAERNIRVMTISATDPAKVMAIGSESIIPCSVVRLQTTDQYQSIASLKRENRLRYIEDFGELHECSEANVSCKCGGSRHSIPAIEEIKRVIKEEYSNTPLYHILRPRVGKQEKVQEILQKAFPEANVILWDADSNSRSKSKSKDDESSCSELEDINVLLEKDPDQPTFIVLKNMLYASKTLLDEHVGILYDRISGKDDTTLQSLLGRACGYERSENTIIFTSKQTVSNYEKCWKDLCSHPETSLLVNIPAPIIDKRMSGVKASAAIRGVSANLSVEAGMGSPYGGGLGVNPFAGSASGRKVANEDDFESSWSEFSSLEDANASLDRRVNREMQNAFYLDSTTKNKKVLSYAEVLSLKGGKKTAGMDWAKIAVGKTSSRLYVCYKDLGNPASLICLVHKLKKIR